MAARKLKILLVSAEVAPFAKVGGLADVAGALPKALKALGHDVRVAMPCYKMIEENPAYGVKDLLPTFQVPIHEGYSEPAWVRQTSIGDVPVYLIASDRYFVDATESKKVYTFSAEPYVFFARAITEFVPRLQPSWTPDIIHCNDWHTGLTPVYLKQLYHNHPTWAKTASVFTVHNLAYQGEFDFEVLRYAGLPDSLFTYDKLEFFGRMCFMKGGLVFSDMVNTVSKTYAEEIQTPEYGARLEGLLRHLASIGRLTGIVNGIDYEVYNPATDPNIAANFSADSLDGKAKCKTDLQKRSDLPKSKNPVIGIISRLADQKGFDLIEQAAEQLMSMPLQLILLGTGDPRYEQLFRDLEAKYPKKLKAHIGFDAILAQAIYAGSDMFLMPSRFEPCGLGQLMSLRYGTIPIVRSTGGLADTIQDYQPRTGKGNGFAFAEYSADAMMDAVRRAAAVYDDAEKWRHLVIAAMKCDYSWNASAKRYVDLYKQAMAMVNLASAA
jgi:starch synthase